MTGNFLHGRPRHCTQMLTLGLFAVVNLRVFMLCNQQKRRKLYAVGHQLVGFYCSMEWTCKSTWYQNSWVQFQVRQYRLEYNKPG